MNRILPMFLLVARLLLLHSSYAQDVFPVTTSLLTTATTTTTSAFLDDCPLVDCCDDDCCGSGTSWNGTQCILNPLSRGWSGFDATIPPVGDQCFPRICCEERCCGDGLEYRMGKLRRQCSPIGDNGDGTTTTTTTQEVPTPTPLLSIPLVPPVTIASTNAPTEIFRSSPFEPRKLVEGQCSFIETISYTLENDDDSYMQNVKVQLQKQSHGDCSSDVMSGLGWFRYNTKNNTQEDITGSEMMLAPIVTDGRTGVRSLQGPPLPDHVIISPATTRKVSSFTTIDVNNTTMKSLDLAFANKVRCYCGDTTNAIEEFLVRFQYEEGSSTVESNADQIDVVMNDDYDNGHTIITHTWFHMLNCDQTDDDEGNTPIYEEFAKMVNFQDDTTDDATTTMEDTMTTIEEMMIDEGVQTYDLRQTAPGPRAAPPPPSPTLPPTPPDKEDGSCSWLQTVSYKPGSSDNNMLQVGLSRQSHGVCAGELMSELGWFNFESSDGGIQEAIVGTDIAAASIITDRNGRNMRMGSPLPDGVTIGPVSSDSIPAFTTTTIDQSLEFVDLAFVNKVRCYCKSTTNVAETTNVVDEFVMRFTFNTSTGIVESNADTVTNNDGIVLHTWMKSLKCDRVEVNDTPNYDKFETFMQQQNGFNDMTLLQNEIESMIPLTSYNMDGTFSGRRYV